MQEGIFNLHNEKVKETLLRFDPERSLFPSPCKCPRTTDEDQVSLSPILKTLQEVQQDLKSTNAQVSSMGNYWQQSLLTAFLPKPSGDSDILSVRAYSDEDLMSIEEGLTTAFMPPTRANELSTRADEPPTGVFEPQKSHQPGFLNSKERLMSLPTKLEIKVKGQICPGVPPSTQD